MKLFSQRIGKTPIKSVIQTDTIDEDLKNALWNGLNIFYWDGKIKYDWIEDNSSDVIVLLKRIWMHFFKKRLDEMPNTFERLQPVIKKFFLGVNGIRYMTLLNLSL